MNYLDAPFTRAALERLTVTDSALVAGLRSHVRRLGTFSGSAVVSMNREACISALLGEPVESFALHAEPRRAAAPDAASMLADALRAAMASQVAPLDEEAVKAIVEDPAQRARWEREERERQGKREAARLVAERERLARV